MVGVTTGIGNTYDIGNRLSYPMMVANKLPRQNIAHRECAPDCEESIGGEDVITLSLLS